LRTRWCLSKAERAHAEQQYGFHAWLRIART
jgi:hypothetical protein